MSEFNAALGLLQLKYVESAIAARREVYCDYRRRLSGVPGVSCLGDEWLAGNNFSYFPVLIAADYPLSRDGLYHHLRKHGVHARRYFYPLISDMPMYRGMSSAVAANLPVARAAAERVLCLPIYEGLNPEMRAHICDVIRSVAREAERAPETLETYA